MIARRLVAHGLVPAVVFTFVLALLACGLRGDQAGGPGERAPVPVRVRVVQKTTDSLSTRYSAAIFPATQVDLAFRVGGYVQHLLQVKDGATTRNVQEGDLVKKGSILATVRQADFQQRAAVADATVAEALATEKQAQLEFDRSKSLLEHAAVSKAELDTATVRLETAHARVAAARAQSGEAALAVEDTRLVSPIDGVLLKRGVEVGSLASPGLVAFVVADTSNVKVIFGAPDVLAEKLQIGGRVKVTVETKPGTLDATVTRIAASADPKARVFEVEARLPNPDGGLKTGMIASLSVPQSALAESNVMLPLTAVVRSPHDPRGFATYVVDGPDEKATVHLRDVKLGDVIGNDVLAIQGLAVGDRVVSQGATVVIDGSSVRVVP
jgi:multidrug efflux system membrane fusion protein